MIEIICGLTIAAGSFCFGVMITVNRYSVKMQEFRKEIAAIESRLKDSKS